MATVDDKIDAAVDQSHSDISEAVAQDINALVAILSDITQALGALQTIHPMAPAVLAGPLSRAMARIDDIRAKLSG